MLLILLACIYITALCRTWGFMLFWALQKASKQPHAHESFIVGCFAGLALISVVFGILSLLMPLGGAAAQLMLALPVIAWWSINKNNSVLLIPYCRQALQQLHPAVVLLLTVSITCVLVMGAAVIIHPDTLMYHAQCIHWIENFRVVPGLVNIDYHYGLQSSWFIPAALFSFRFTGTGCLTFLNSTVIIWYIIFVLAKVNQCLVRREPADNAVWKGMLWLTLYLFSCLSYTQVRLTATSASPDFIAVAYTWLIFLLFFTSISVTPASSTLLLLAFFGFFAVTIKLSALPVVLFTTYIYYRYSISVNANTLLLPLITGIIVLTPFVIRNVITSGYLLFPSPFPDLFNAAWKAPLQALIAQKQYIKAYARVAAEADATNAKYVVQRTVSEWIPVWWHNRSVADKMIIAGLMVLPATAVLYLKKIKWEENIPYLTGLFFSVVGIVFWFMQAPDPRFGFGFIIPAQAILLYCLFKYRLAGFMLHQKWLVYLLYACSTVAAAYTVYRAVYFLPVKNMIQPAGVFPVACKTIRCHGVGFNIPLQNKGCGSTPLPCMYDSCTHFTMRGKNITDGFKAGE